MKVLVTGGAGFIGSNFVRLAVKGAFKEVTSVTVVDKLTYAGTLSNFSKNDLQSFEFIQGDICDSDLMSKLAIRHDAIVNFAAESHVDRSIAGAREFILTNVLGTQSLLDAVRFGSVNVMIQVSTDEVYGSLAKGSWDESQPVLPNSPYAASKASADLMARSYFQTYGCDVRITRSCNNYGIHQFPEKIIPLFVTNLIDGLQVPIYGSGQNIREWIHVNDHCLGIYQVLTQGRAGEIYNIGAGNELTNIELTHKIFKLMNKSESHISYVADRKGHDIRYSVNWDKISKEFGFKPQVDFDSGLADTINWYQENDNWWRSLK
jgi:dTDP-glucose 4,6-dehydratase